MTVRQIALRFRISLRTVSIWIKLAESYSSPQDEAYRRKLVQSYPGPQACHGARESSDKF